MITLKQQYFAGIFETKAFLVKGEPFTLSSGHKSHLYLNHRHFLTQSKYLMLIAKLYHELTSHIPQPFQLGAVDSVASPIIVGAMAVLFNLDFIIMKREPLKHGTQEFSYGNINKKIVLIDDMTSTGETLLDAAHKIRQLGGQVEHAIISAYRDRTAIANLAKQNIHLIAIASFAEITHALQDSLTEQEKALIAQELNQKGGT